MARIHHRSRRRSPHRRPPHCAGRPRADWVSLRRATIRLGGPVGRLIDHLRSRFWLPDTDEAADQCAYLKPLVAAQKGGAIATLNYDNTLERTAELIDVAGGWPDGDVEVGLQHIFRTRVLPIHGHLGWELRQDRGQELTRVVNAGGHQDPADLAYPYNPAIIFGASNKLRHYGPFLPLLDALRSEFNEARTVITIGYSWRGPHINDMLRAWAYRGHDFVQQRFDHIEGPPRWRLIVGTGPTSAELPPLASAIRTHMGGSVDVRPIRGSTSEVIAELEASKVLTDPHLGTNRKFWCGA